MPPIFPRFSSTVIFRYYDSRLSESSLFVVNLDPASGTSPGDCLKVLSVADDPSDSSSLLPYTILENDSVSCRISFLGFYLSFFFDSIKVGFEFPQYLITEIQYSFKSNPFVQDILVFSAYQDSEPSDSHLFSVLTDSSFLSSVSVPDGSGGSVALDLSSGSDALSQIYNAVKLVDFKVNSLLARDVSSSSSSISNTSTLDDLQAEKQKLLDRIAVDRNTMATADFWISHYTSLGGDWLSYIPQQQTIELNAEAQLDYDNELLAAIEAKIADFDNSVIPDNLLPVSVIFIDIYYFY